jgi:hypothetical protein
MSKRKKSKKTEHKRPFTPWHEVFHYILEELLPEDIFDITAEQIVGKLPLKIDFIVIKKIKQARAELPVFFDFLNDYSYAVIEYKSPFDYLTFDDYLQTTAYSILYKQKKKLKDFSKIIRVCVYNITEQGFFDLLEKSGLIADKTQDGVHYISNNPYNSFLINLEEIDKSDKALLLAFLSRHKENYDEIYNCFRDKEYFIRIAEFLNYLINRRDFMRLVERDKEWAKRAKWTLEEFVQHLPAELRLHGLKPEEVLKNFKAEERLQGLKAEERLQGLKAEERLQGLKAEERLQGLKAEERLQGLKAEEIKEYLKKIDKDK